MLDALLMSIAIAATVMVAMAPGLGRGSRPMRLTLVGHPRRVPARRRRSPAGVLRPVTHVTERVPEASLLPPPAPEEPEVETPAETPVVVAPRAVLGDAIAAG